LTPEGRQRAQALVAVGRRAGVAAAYHTQYKRSTQTAQPLASELGIPMIQVDYVPGEEAAHAEALVRAILAAYAGKVVLVVGHTTTIPVILQRLGIQSPPPISESDYGNLFVIIRTGSEATLVPGKFGP
jgi:broad specificity phosphatase PhoE